MELAIVIIILFIGVLDISFALPRYRDKWWADKYKELESSFKELREDHEELKGAHNRSVEKWQKHFETENKTFNKELSTKIDEYFENDFEITTCYIQMIDADIILKIGDEEFVHEMKLGSSGGPPGEMIKMEDLLEKARAEWKSKKEELE